MATTVQPKRRTDVVQAMLASGMEPARVVALARESLHMGVISERRFAEVVRLVGWKP